ncbi:MAG: hypothetical protein OXE96_05640 [Gemmatimonadetes bacterium]|nr:hypothetical protein [Gemmatimonadota bacterium]
MTAPSDRAMWTLLDGLASTLREWSRQSRDFNRLALEIHEIQRAANPVLRRYWDANTARDPSSWEEIPPVPVAAFRDVPIVSGVPEVTFRTSGTTGGGGRRGEHHVASLDLYHASARGNYRRHLLGGLETVSVVSLIPCPEDAPDSSLSVMAGFICREPEVSSATWAFNPEHGVDAGAVREAVGDAFRVGDPVLLLTTAFALVHLLDELAGQGADNRHGNGERASTDGRLPLPEGSRVMETGGFKGRVAAVDRGALYGRVERVLGVPESHIASEYGMTELLSQAYDRVAAAESPCESAARVLRFPPWVRTRALDPATLAPLPPGDSGLLAYFDLANAGSVCHVLTEDFGCTTDDGGLHLLGRAPGASLRGCSLVAESFLRATRRGARS